MEGNSMDDVLRGAQNEDFLDEVGLDVPADDLAIAVADSLEFKCQETYEVCLEKVLEVFPDISRDHVKKLWNERQSSMTEHQLHMPISRRLIEKLLDDGQYPTERARQRDLKRKRSTLGGSPEREVARWSDAPVRSHPFKYTEIVRGALYRDFDTVPVKFINEAFYQHKNYYQTFLAIEKADRERDVLANPPFVRLKHRRFSADNLEAFMLPFEQAGFDSTLVKEEMLSAKERCQKEAGARRLIKETLDAKLAREVEHREKGEVMTCGCCFLDDVPLSDITHCSSENPHFFCFDCARRNAENDIGNMRYALCCMDQSKCEFSFDREERNKFLDSVSVARLDKIQQQDELRRAGMEDLEQCPFCDFAAVCPPVEIDKEFRCQGSECGEVSCRLCRQLTHIPLSCDEFKKENGLSQRRIIEEARTEALIRSCPKCKVRILKEDGCNKVVCTKCGAAMCDYCGADITLSKYDHFDMNGPNGGRQSGRQGKCFLYDQSSRRKEEQVDKAENEVRQKVRKENPDLSESELRINFSERVMNSEDAKRRKEQQDYENRHPRRREHIPPPPPPMEALNRRIELDLRRAVDDLRGDEGEMDRRRRILLQITQRQRLAEAQRAREAADNAVAAIQDFQAANGLPAVHAPPTAANRRAHMELPTILAHQQIALQEEHRNLTRRLEHVSNQLRGPDANTFPDAAEARRPDPARPRRPDNTLRWTDRPQKFGSNEGDRARQMETQSSTTSAGASSATASTNSTGRAGLAKDSRFGWMRDENTLPNLPGAFPGHQQQTGGESNATREVPRRLPLPLFFDPLEHYGGTYHNAGQTNGALRSQEIPPVQNPRAACGEPGLPHQHAPGHKRWTYDPSQFEFDPMAPINQGGGDMDGPVIQANVQMNAAVGPWANAWPGPGANFNAPPGNFDFARLNGFGQFGTARLAIPSVLANTTQAGAQTGTDAVKKDPTRPARHRQHEVIDLDGPEADDDMASAFSVAGSDPPPRARRNGRARETAGDRVEDALDGLLLLHDNNNGGVARENAGEDDHVIQALEEELDDAEEDAEHRDRFGFSNLDDEDEDDEFGLNFFGY